MQVHAVLFNLPNCCLTLRRFLTSGWKLNVEGDMCILTNQYAPNI